MKYSKVQPIWHFIILSLATASLYQFFWFYKIWMFFKDKDKLAIRPSFRALFSMIYIWGLCKRINELLKKEQISYNIPTLAVGFGWIFTIALSEMPDPWWLFCFLAFAPLLPIVHAMNLYWVKQEKKPLPTKPFQVWQGVLIGLGLTLLALGAFGMMIETLIPGYLDA